MEVKWLTFTRGKKKVSLEVNLNTMNRLFHVADNKVKHVCIVRKTASLDICSKELLTNL